MDYRIAFPEGMDDGDWAVQEAKGWVDVTVCWDGEERLLSFYDQTRLMQTIGHEMARTGYFAERSLVVVSAVTPENIEAAVAALAARGFVDI
ncbi:MAG: hypothetical protein HOW97_28460 [Catenulispora sp.]|nr:hypothetical protein [Catenulispora sp.]